MDGRPLLPGRRSQHHTSHLPCTSCRCPAAARRWGRRTCRKAPSGTAGTGGSSPRCPPHTACGLEETGQGEKVPEQGPRPPMPRQPQGVPLPNRHPPGASGITMLPHPTSPPTPTVPGHQPANSSHSSQPPSRPRCGHCPAPAPNLLQEALISFRAPQRTPPPGRPPSGFPGRISAPACTVMMGTPATAPTLALQGGGGQPGCFPAHPRTLHISLCSSKRSPFPPLA